MAKTSTSPKTHKLPAGTLVAQQPTVQAPPAAVEPALASAMATVANQLLATMQAGKGLPAAPVTVALRGGQALAQVVLTNKPYRAGADHNAKWWAQVTAACAQGPAAVQALLAAGVPAPFVGYAVRRGYLAPAPATT